jgi:hypothetical protein
MAFRDETEALRQRVGMLEAELETEREKLAEARTQLEELPRLRARVEELERELAKHAPRPAPPPPRAVPREQKGSGDFKHIVPLLVFVGVTGVILLVTFWDDLFAPDWDAPPTHGMVLLALHPSPPPLDASVESERAASELGPSCSGYIAEAPHVVLRTTAPTRVSLMATSSTDTVLVVRTADGQVRCDDDSGGNRNPQLTIELGAPGDHRVWVGTYADGQSADFRLSIATVAGESTATNAPPALPAQAIDLAGPPTFLPISGPTTAPLEGQAIGVVDAQNVSAGCRGFLPVAPTALVQLEAPRRLRLRTRSSTDADLVMLVRTADGSIYCDDDQGGTYQPLVEADLPAGEHRVWVGTFHRTATALPFALTVEDPAAQPAPPDRALTPIVGRWPLGGDATITMNGDTRGEVASAPFGAGCAGLVPRAPHFVFAVDAPRRVSLGLEGDAPMELMIGFPDGSISCSTDRVSAVWGAGDHAVWIGTRTEAPVDATFVLSARTGGS